MTPLGRLGHVLTFLVRVGTIGPPSAAARPFRLTVALCSKMQVEFFATCCIDNAAVLSVDLHGEGQESAGEEP